MWWVGNPGFGFLIPLQDHRLVILDQLLHFAIGIAQITKDTSPPGARVDAGGGNPIFDPVQAEIALFCDAHTLGEGRIAFRRIYEPGVVWTSRHTLCTAGTAIGVDDNDAIAFTLIRGSRCLRADLHARGNSALIAKPWQEAPFNVRIFTILDILHP